MGVFCTLGGGVGGFRTLGGQGGSLLYARGGVGGFRTLGGQGGRLPYARGRSGSFRTLGEEWEASVR